MSKKRARAFPKKCDKCTMRLKGPVDSKYHYDKHPTHRNKRQRQQFESNHKARIGGLPTVSRSTAKRRAAANTRTPRYCSKCGWAFGKAPAHLFCAGCGSKR
jgi:hypothetical protein